MKQTLALWRTIATSKCSWACSGSSVGDTWAGSAASLGDVGLTAAAILILQGYMPPRPFFRRFTWERGRPDTAGESLQPVTDWEARSCRKRFLRV